MSERVIKSNNENQSSDPILIQFHDSKEKPIKAQCIKDNPPYIGFPPHPLKKGEVVEVEGTVHNDLGFCLAVPDMCAFYKYEYFMPVKEN